MGLPQTPTPTHLYPEALQLKLYQAFIFSIPILFSIILFLLFYLFYLKRRASTSSSTAPILPSSINQAASFLSPVSPLSPSLALMFVQLFFCNLIWICGISIFIFWCFCSHVRSVWRESSKASFQQSCLMTNWRQGTHCKFSYFTFSLRDFCKAVVLVFRPQLGKHAKKWTLRLPITTVTLSIHTPFQHFLWTYFFLKNPRRHAKLFLDPGLHSIPHFAQSQVQVPFFFFPWIWVRISNDIHYFLKSTGPNHDH